jgi:hypothetical protein
LICERRQYTVHTQHTKSIKCAATHSGVAAREQAEGVSSTESGRVKSTKKIGMMQTKTATGRTRPRG